MLITILAGLFVLGVVIIVHEFGHFIVAKLAGVYVKVFSIGFGKKLWRWRQGETVYALSALPFGGYVKFAGETDLATFRRPTPIFPSAPRRTPDSAIPREPISRPIASGSARHLVRVRSNYLLADCLHRRVFRAGFNFVPPHCWGM